MIGQVFQTSIFLASLISFLLLHAVSQGDERSTQKRLRERVSIQLPEDLVAHTCRPEHLTEGSGVGTTGQQIAAEEEMSQVIERLCFHLEQGRQ
jgi:hypothetical protein